MKRVKQARTILHKHNVASKVDNWDGLIFAAESELHRIHARSSQLEEAVKVFKKRKAAGDPFVQPENHSSQEQHAV